MSMTAIINGNVYNHQTGEFSKNTVLVKDKVIASILPPDSPLPDCNIIDATNQFLTPGLIDTCSQIGLKEIGVRWEGHDGYEPNVEKGFQLEVIDGVYPFDKAFQDAISSGVTAAHVVSSPEAIVGAKTSVIHTHGLTVDEMVLKKNLGFIFSMGDVPKSAFWASTKTPLTRMGIAKKIRESLRALQIKYNLQETPIYIRAHRADDIATAFRIAGEFGFQFNLVHGTELPLVSSQPSNSISSVIAGPCFQPMERGELKNLDWTLFRSLYDRNVPFTFSTDHPVSSVTHLQLEGALALKAGVPEKIILNGLTLDAARLFKIDHLTGSLMEGLLADIVLWNKHPLDLTARTVRTFIKGKEVYRWE
ncbi:amidohydrolase family protein [Neobacillus sp. YIM B06451]|uniref:amidohydrolase family protein n=1 Tax=Neobacillus sp. YIM B06451 TaxID=3070994 RepID=UPI0029306255|nr:amidohydrolase family protein [Neobacillus sp. YIM B06451]